MRTGSPTAARGICRWWPKARPTPKGTIGDAKESAAFVKRGKYVGITLEMIRKSDIARIQAVPKALALDAIRTRSAAIAGIFTAASGTGPTLADDSTVLFHVDHGANVQTTAFSAAAWKAARAECAKMAELGIAQAAGALPEVLPGARSTCTTTRWSSFGYGAGRVAIRRRRTTT